MPRSDAGWARTAFGLYIPIPAGTGAVSALTALTIGYIDFLEKAVAVVAVAGTGTAANRTINVIRNASIIATGTLTLANTAVVGALIPLTVTDALLEEVDTISVDFPTAGAVAFTAGAVNLYLGFRSRTQQR